MVNRTIKTIMIIGALITALVMFSGCAEGYSGTYNDTSNTMAIASTLAERQPTPTDISYSLERYNLIRRAYWVNGMREKAATLVCPIEKPLSYIVLFAGNTVVGRFVVDGKVSSLNSFLSPDSEYYEVSAGEMPKYNEWVADVDGSYGENDNGIFFFTPDGNYFEWTGEYLYSDIPFEIDNPVVKYEVN